MTLQQRTIDNAETLELGVIMGLSRKNIIELERWKREKVICPWCLYLGRLYDFKTFGIRGKKKLSKYAVCPDCENRMKVSTLRMVTRYSMLEFANYFWENFYVWHGWMNKTIPKVKERLKHFTYKNRQIFWNVWKEWKNGDRKELQKWREQTTNHLTTRGKRDTHTCNLLDFLPKTGGKSKEC